MGLWNLPGKLTSLKRPRLLRSSIGSKQVSGNLIVKSEPRRKLKSVMPSFNGNLMIGLRVKSKNKPNKLKAKLNSMKFLCS